MTGRLLLALLVVLAVAGLGLLSQRILFAGAREEPPREQGRTAAESPVPKTPAAPPAVELSARVTGAVGNAEVFLPSEGRWRPVVEGQKLGLDAVLRTKEGRVSLGIGEGLDVTVSSSSQFRLGELSSHLSRVRLEGGHVMASVAGKEGQELIVQVLGSDAEARTKDGSFAVLRRGGAQVTVAGTRGQVSLSAAGRQVVIQSGEQSEVVPGAPPRAPIRIPGETFIKLSRGLARKLRVRSALVDGETAPGAVVSVNGLEATNDRGHFSLSVPLQEGDNELIIVARDVLGRETRQRVHGIDVRSKPPKLSGSIEW